MSLVCSTRIRRSTPATSAAVTSRPSRRTIRTALASGKTELIVTAAAHAGRDGVEPLRRIATDEQSDAGLRTQALEHLAERYPDDAAAVLAVILPQPSSRLVVEAALWAGKLARPELVAVAIAAIEAVQPEWLWPLAAALGPEHRAEVEPALLSRW